MLQYLHRHPHFHYAAAAISLFLLLVTVHSQERVTLAVPIVPPTVTDYQVRTLHLDLGDRGTTDDDTIVVDLEATTGSPSDVNHIRRFTYSGAVANSMILALNKANLTNRSLNQRIMDRLIADGLITGTVTGTVP
jgi:hypothetical protein